MVSAYWLGNKLSEQAIKIQSSRMISFIKIVEEGANRLRFQLIINWET